VVSIYAAQQVTSAMINHSILYIYTQRCVQILIYTCDDRRHAATSVINSAGINICAYRIVIGLIRARSVCIFAAIAIEHCTLIVIGDLDDYW
jgi:hypothetical protein